MNSGFFKTIGIFITLLVFTVLIAMVLGSIFEGPSGNVALVKLKGEITSEESLFSSAVSSESVVSALEDAKLNPDVKAIVLEIDSPGGSVVPTREIVSALKQIDKPKICWLREVAASGAYWIASVCDKIVADEYTLTGSIGVVGSYLEFSGFMEKYGIEYVRLVSGEEKDTGTPYRQPTQKELQAMQEIIDEIHQTFVSEVTENRNLSSEAVARISEAAILTGKQAKELGLIDVLGGKQEVIDLTKEMANLTEIQFRQYEKGITIADLMSGFFAKGLVEYFVSEKINLKV